MVFSSASLREKDDAAAAAGRTWATQAARAPAMSSVFFNDIFQFRHTVKIEPSSGVDFLLDLRS
jgi:hypothetical protein